MEVHFTPEQEAQLSRIATDRGAGAEQLVRDAWIARGNERFNVVAKAEDPAKATERQLLAMLQTMLADRFQLRFHHEAAEMPGFD